jgi:pimeloyl-ACP methyl ester carboxylesterase
MDPPHEPTEPADRRVEKPDGGALLARDHGPADGAPVVYQHGSPGCRVMSPDALAAASARGVRVISYDRPGYAGSSRHEGRRVRDAAADTAVVADAFALDRFAVWGVSGGGPPALAFAALLGDRVEAAAVVAGLAPYGAPGLDFTAGMGESSQIEFHLARDDRAALEAFVQRSADEVLASPEGVVAARGSLLSQRDRDLLDGPFRDQLLERLQISLAPGLGGWIDDDLAYVEPWGVDLQAIRIPVAIFHGRRDLMVPFAHGEWLAAAIPGARLESAPDEGHMTLGADPGRALDWIAATTAGGGVRR